MAVDIARLGVEVQSQSVLTAQRRLHGLTTTGAATERRMLRLSTSSRALAGSISISEQQFQALGRTAQRVGRNLTLFIGLPLLALGAKAAQTAAKFETEMTKINTLVGISTQELAGMEEQMLALSRVSGRGPTELAKALFTVTSAGARGAEAMEILERAAKASAIGLGEAQEIARATTAIIQAYGAENMSAARATDILASTVREGNLEASALAPVLGRVIGLASQLGISFEEVGANIATFTRLGVSAEEAITGLRGVMNTLISPSQAGAEALAEVGLSFEGLRRMARERGLTETMRVLVEQFQGQEEALSQIIPNVRALSNVLGTAGAQGQAYSDILDNIANGHGIVNEGFETVGDTAQHQWNQAKAAVEAATLSLRDSTLPMMKELASVIRETAEWFSNLDEQTQRNIVRFGLWAVAAGPVVSIFARLIKIIPRVIGLMRTLNLLMIANPWGAAAAAIGGVAAILAGRYIVSANNATKATNEFTQALFEQNKTVSEAQKALEGLTLQRMLDNTQEAIRITREQMGGLRRELEGYFETVRRGGAFSGSTFQEWLETVARPGGSGAHEQFLQLQENLSVLERQAETIQEINRLENRLAQSRANQGTVARERIPILEQQIDKLRESIGLAAKFAEQQERATEATKTGNDEAQRRIKINEDIFSQFQQARRVIEPLQLMDEIMLGFPVSLDQANEAMQKLEAQFNSVGTQQQRDEIAKYIQQLQRLIDTMNGVGRATDEAANTTKTLAEEAGKAERVANSLGFTFQSAFEDAIVSGRRLSRVLQALLEDVIRVINRLLVVEPLVKGLQGFITSTFGGDGGATTQNAKGGVFTGLTTTSGVGGRQMFRERGEEAALPLTRMSDGRLGVAMAGGGGGGDVQVNVINYSGNDVETREGRTQSGGQKVDVIITRAVADDIRRGGSTARAMQETFNLNRSGRRI